MSPLLRDGHEPPHRCNKPFCTGGVDTIWECPDCQALWYTKAPFAGWPWYFTSAKHIYWYEMSPRQARRWRRENPDVKPVADWKLRPRTFS